MHFSQNLISDEHNSASYHWIVKENTEVSFMIIFINERESHKVDHAELISHTWNELFPDNLL